MNTDLTPENEQYLEHAVATGLFEDRNAALNTAVTLLKRREDIIREVNAGIEEIEQGRVKPLDIDAIMAAVDARLDEIGFPKE